MKILVCHQSVQGSKPTHCGIRQSWQPTSQSLEIQKAGFGSKRHFRFEGNYYYFFVDDEQDISLARLGALGALADVDGNDLLNEVPSTINYDDLVNSATAGFASRSSSKSDSQKSAWLTRASELLDLSSGDSRDNTPQHESESYNSGGSSGQQKGSEDGNLIPQIVMNPWDPNQTPMMTLAPLANAVQAYQQHFLSMKAAQAQEGGGGSSSNDTAQDEDDSNPLGKDKVLCVPPDEEMGFLINLPPPLQRSLAPLYRGHFRKTQRLAFSYGFPAVSQGRSAHESFGTAAGRRPTAAAAGRAAAASGQKEIYSAVHSGVGSTGGGGKAPSRTSSATVAPSDAESDSAVGPAIRGGGLNPRSKEIRFFARVHD